MLAAQLLLRRGLEVQQAGGSKRPLSVDFYFFSCFLVNSPLSSWRLTLLFVPFSLCWLSLETCCTACWMAVRTICLLAFCNFASSCSFVELSPVKREENPSVECTFVTGHWILYTVRLKKNPFQQETIYYIAKVPVIPRQFNKQFGNSGLYV